MRMTTSLLAAAALLLSFAIPAMAGPKVKFETTMGAFVIEVNEEKAPITAANFLAYVDEGFYDGVVFHRVIPNFMAQGGGFAAEAGMYVEKPTRDPIQNEADNGLRNVKGSVAMARTSDPHSASAQFFVNFKDNDFLDHTAKTPRGWGYAVFGQVVEGMDVVEKMAFQGTGDKLLTMRLPNGETTNAPAQNVPLTDIVITSASRLDEAS